MNYEHIFILYDRSILDKKYVRSFSDKKNKIIPLGYYSHLQDTYQKTLDTIVQHMNNNYVLWISPKYECTGTIDCAKHIYWLERTFANVSVCSDHKVLNKIELADGAWVVPNGFDYESYYGYVVKKESLVKRINADVMCVSVQ